MKKYIPLVRQHDETDCGAACMSMILQYYGRKLPLPALREDVGVDQYGANMAGLHHAAEKYGLQTCMLEGTAEAFTKEVSESVIRLPVIGQILNPQGFEHFVVISAVSPNYIYCCDPGAGTYALTRDEFASCFLGHIIAFRKTDSFMKGNDRRHSWLRFLKLIMHQKLLLISVALLSGLITGIGLFGSYIFQFLIDRVLGNLDNNNLLDENLDLFAILVTGIAILYLFRFAAQLLRGKLSAFMAKRINLPLMLGYYDHVMDLPMTFFSARKTGDLITRFHDANKVQEALTSATLTILIDTVTVGFCGVILYRLSPSLFLITLIMLVTYVLISSLYVNPMEKQSRFLLSQNGELSSYLKESIDGVQTVKAFQAESYVKQRMKELFVRLQEEGIRFSMMGLRKNTIIELFTSVGILALLWAGACSVIDGSMSAGSLITFYTLLAYFLSPVENLAGLQAEIQEAVIAADRLNDILDAALEETHPEKENSLQNGNVEIDRVSFRYGNRQLTLKDLSLRIENGQHAALVGGSGCGKTSVFKLLMGFSRAESGTIRMGDVDMDDLSISCLRSGIAYVPQEIFLFSATIRDNLLLGDIKADDDRLKAVLDACGCDFVKTLPMELDTMLEENGENLSGGQRQRLAIARAMLRDPRILILDEATSSLDSLSERRILDAIYKLNPEMTVLMSAHRLNTVRQCDKIFVMDKGCVIQSGTHDDLVLSPGLYRQMWESQNG